jgi:hypothetical protein
VVPQEELLSDVLIVAYENSDQFRAYDFAKEEGMQRGFDREHGRRRYLDTFVKRDGAWLFAERKHYVDTLEEHAPS